MSKPWTEPGALSSILGIKTPKAKRIRPLDPETVEQARRLLVEKNIPSTVVTARDGSGTYTVTMTGVTRGPDSETVMDPDNPPSEPAPFTSDDWAEYVRMADRVEADRRRRAMQDYVEQQQQQQRQYEYQYQQTPPPPAPPIPPQPNQLTTDLFRRIMQYRYQQPLLPPEVTEQLRQYGDTVGISDIIGPPLPTMQYPFGGVSPEQIARPITDEVMEGLALIAQSVLKRPDLIKTDQVLVTMAEGVKVLIEEVDVLRGLLSDLLVVYPCHAPDCNYISHAIGIPCRYQFSEIGYRLMSHNFEGEAKNMANGLPRRLHRGPCLPCQLTPWMAWQETGEWPDPETVDEAMQMEGLAG